MRVAAAAIHHLWVQKEDDRRNAPQRARCAETNHSGLGEEAPWFDPVATGSNSIGFGTHSGTVAAASDWDGSMEVKTALRHSPMRHDADIVAAATVMCG